MLLAGIFCKYLISLKSWKYWSQYSFIYLLTKGVKSTAAKWWRKEKSVMISDSGGARAEFTEQIASVMCECDQEAKCKTRRNARCLVHARGAPLRPEMVQFYNSHLSWSYFQGGNYSNFPFSRAFPRDIFVYNPILWVSHSHRLISWQSSRSILLWTLWRLTRGHGVITSRVTLLALIRIQSPWWQRWWHAHRASQMEI